jgi:hypothetical protein
LLRFIRTRQCEFSQYASRSSTAGAGNAASGKIVGGAQDNGTICFDPSSRPSTGRPIFGGDGGWCAADPTDPNVLYGECV